MEQMQAQTDHVGARIIWGPIVGIGPSRPPFRLIGDSTVDCADTLIATGASAKGSRWTSVINVQTFSN
jgi:thioredoxin reductase (NADPH)